MKQLEVRNTKVFVQTLTTAASKSTGLYIPETSQSAGIVLFVGSGVKDLKPGMKVYFGGNKEQIRIDDKDIQVMEESNVYAIDPTHPFSEEQENVQAK